MIRLFSPPTRDFVLRPDAVTVGSLLLHIAAVIFLLVPLAKVAKEQLFDRLVVFLVPPDPVGTAQTGTGTAAYNSAPTVGGVKERPPTQAGDETLITARGSQPTLDASDLQIARPSDGEKAYTVLEVDSAIVRDPTSAAPEYPPHLLRAGIEGSAMVRFVVDSTGEVDTLTYRVLSSSNPDFSVAVRRALPMMRFKAAIQAGRRVRQVAQQTFTFRISARDSAAIVRTPIPPA